ncbi:MAG: hypothetical protein NZ533_11375, partial [Casimicrobiaceae bacterium]|nr:hypothetical protein [Casimicrobiaceae bacterium]
GTSTTVAREEAAELTGLSLAKSLANPQTMEPLPTLEAENAVTLVEGVPQKLIGRPEVGWITGKFPLPLSRSICPLPRSSFAAAPAPGFGL